MKRLPHRLVPGVVPPKATWRMDRHADFLGVIDAGHMSVQLPLTHVHQAGRTAAVEIELYEVHRVCQGLLDLVDEMTGTTARLVIERGAADELASDRVGDAAEDVLPPVLMLVQRLAFIALLLEPCPPPKLADGYAECTCDTGVPWPCTTTQAAWMARGQSAETEVQAVYRGVGEDIAFENIAERLRGEGLGENTGPDGNL